MRPLTHVTLLLGLGLAIAGCGITDPYSHRTSTTSRPHSITASTTSAAQNPGEPPAPAPPSPQSQSPRAPVATPQQAIRAFALLYTNWTWKTLASHLRQLAAISVNPARLAEQQASVAAGRDSEVTSTRVYNRGQIVSISPSQTQPGEWVIVTREQTGGTSQYAGLQPSWHVTLAELVHLPGGYAVWRWLPQN
jgi:hypothetical protein